MIKFYSPVKVSRKKGHTTFVSKFYQIVIIFIRFNCDILKGYFPYSYENKRTVQEHKHTIMLHVPG